MADLYSCVFNDIFNNCVPYFMHDFLNVRCIIDGNKKYCLSTYKKVFEETIKVLEKSKYNGEIVMPETIAFGAKYIFPVSSLIKDSLCFAKKKIIVRNDVIKLKNARESFQKDRIFLLPIDGISSFANGSSDFSMVIILQKENKAKKSIFETKSISIFNPIRRDIFTFDDVDGCKYNNKKISFDKVFKDVFVESIFVNDQTQKNSFDLTKLSQISNSISLSNSIFSALVELLTTNKNLCIYKTNDDFSEFINFAIKKTILVIKKIGMYSVIGKEEIINKIIKN